MIPVPCFDKVTCSWLDLKAEGYVVHGFLVFLTGDRYFPEYIASDGLSDLNVWSGRNCAIYTIHSPADTWVTFARGANNVWWRRIGKTLNEDIATEEAMAKYGETEVVVVGSETRRLKDAFEPLVNRYLHDAEMGRVMEHFELTPASQPCLIMFKELFGDGAWYKDLRPLVNVPQEELREALKNWFAGEEFAGLMHNGHE